MGCEHSLCILSTDLSARNYGIGTPCVCARTLHSTALLHCLSILAAVGTIESLLKKASVPLRNVSFQKFPGTPPSQSYRVGGVGVGASSLVGCEAYLSSLGISVGSLYEDTRAGRQMSNMEIVLLVGSGGSQVTGQTAARSPATVPAATGVLYMVPVLLDFSQVSAVCVV